MIRNIPRTISFIMFLVMIIFVIYSINNPQASFPFNNIFTYIIYAGYVFLMIIFFVMSFRIKK